MGKASNGIPVFEVRFGRKDPGDPDMQLLARYAVSGFAAGDTSRHDQVMAAMDELPLPSAINWIEIERREREDVEAHLAGVRRVTTSGLLAELVVRPEDTGEHLLPAEPARAHANTPVNPMLPIKKLTW